MFQPEEEGDLESVEEEVDELELATAADLLDLRDGPPPEGHLHNEIGRCEYSSTTPSLLSVCSTLSSCVRIHTRKR